MVLIMDVYKLVVKFQLLRLRLLCEQYIEASICTRNVLVALKCAEELGLEFIKEFCMRVVIREVHFNQIIQGVDFENLDKRLMVEIIRRKQLQQQNTLPDTTPHLSSTDVPTLVEDMKELLTTSIFSDFSLCLDGKEIKSHKVVLAARSSYFEALFRSFPPPEAKSN